MKNMNGRKALFLALLAVLALGTLACKKEIEPKTELITFTAIMDNGEPSSKVAINIDEAKGKAMVSFTAGDVIIVWDGLRKTQTVTLQESNINPDGSATFSITTDTESGYYYALASEGYIFDTTHSGIGIYSTNSAFNDIAAGRIPHAAWAQCAKGENKFVFKSPMTLLKFDTISEGAAKIEFKGNDNEDITGCIRFRKEGYAELYSYDFVEKYVYKSIVVRTNEWDEDCYLALPGGITLSKGFTLTVYNSNDEMLIKARTDKSFTAVAGKLVDLGTLEYSAMTPYELWQDGYSVEIDGVKYDKSTYGDATLVEKGGKANGSGVFFINEEASVYPAYAAGTCIYISNNPYSMAKLTPIGTLYYTAPSVLAFKSIEMESNESGNLIEASGEIKKLIFDDCHITLHGSVLDRTDASKCLGALTILDSDFIVDPTDESTGTYIINTASATSDHFSISNIKVKNSIFWSSTPHEFRIVQTDKQKGVPAKSLSIENNTFYNVDNSSYLDEFRNGYRPFFTLGSVRGSLSINANLIYSTSTYSEKSDGTPANDTRVAGILKCNFDIESDNLKGKLASASAWYGLNSKVCYLAIITEGSGSPTVTTTLKTNLNTLTEDPFEEINLSEYLYEKKSAYKNYGAIW